MMYVRYVHVSNKSNQFSGGTHAKTRKPYNMNVLLTSRCTRAAPYMSILICLRKALFVRILMFKWYSVVNRVNMCFICFINFCTCSTCG